MIPFELSIDLRLPQPKSGLVRGRKDGKAGPGVPDRPDPLVRVQVNRIELIGSFAQPRQIRWGCIDTLSIVSTQSQCHCLAYSFYAI